MLLGNLLWWRRADSVARSFRHAKAWRIGIAVWAGGMFSVVVLVVLSRGIFT